MLKILTALVFLLPLIARANPADAERIQRSYELSSEKWILEMKLANTPEARDALAAKRPDPLATANAIWQNIAADLARDWTIPFGAFFLEITRNLTITDANGNTAPAFVAEQQRVLKAFSENHLKKPGIAPFIVALIESGDPQALSMLEKIAKEHPEEPTQGIAALGASLVLKNLGENPEVMQKRLNYLRDAIIKSADKEIGGRSVADIASDELYVIRFLTKGRVAPPLSGMDVAARPVKLSDFKGRTVVLLFWDAKGADTDRVIKLTNQLVTKFKTQPVTVLGVTPESAERIKTLQADDIILWNNLSDAAEKLAAEYRISNRPSVFVIDAEGKIQYTGLPGSFVELTVDALLNPEKK